MAKIRDPYAVLNRGFQYIPSYEARSLAQSDEYLDVSRSILRPDSPAETSNYQLQATDPPMDHHPSLQPSSGIPPGIVSANKH